MKALTYVGAWGALMAGFFLTLGLAHARLGAFYLPVAMVIAAAQMMVVMWYFMHLRVSSRLTWLFAAGGIYWLGILFVLGLADYLSRGWLK
ncbi:MAG TPA: cytochrome C oxidase subunit IV family protein [Verrucomicrobiae bacterium]|jgi:cytochrome c oxidase subunit 4|nr:cytochrome C oxidase subunit IV family protein [Verrucomicrobiae bacterium]